MFCKKTLAKLTFLSDKWTRQKEPLNISNLIVIEFEVVRLSPNACTILLQYFTMLYNGITNTSDANEDNGSVLKIKHNKEDKMSISQFEKLNYNDENLIF